MEGFRGRLIDLWAIMEGERVLEVGCGQGDATAVLADRVGPTGAVLAIDSAGRDYGAPATLGACLDGLRGSKLGPRIDVRLETEIEDVKRSECDGALDRVVMVHASWYLASRERLVHVLRRARELAPLLCLSDWDLVPTRTRQFGHYAAIVFQMQARALSLLPEGNVRTPLSRAETREAVVDAGWTPIAEGSIDTSDEPDGDWEVATALDVAPDAITRAAQAGRSAWSVWLHTQQDVLLQARQGGVAALDSWWLTAQQ